MFYCAGNSVLNIIKMCHLKGNVFHSSLIWLYYFFSKMQSICFNKTYLHKLSVSARKCLISIKYNRNCWLKKSLVNAILIILINVSLIKINFKKRKFNKFNNGFVKFISIHSNFNKFWTENDKIILQNVTYCINRSKL